MSRLAGLSLSLLFIAFSTFPWMVAAAPDAEPRQETGPPPVSSPWRTWQLDAPLETVRSELLALIGEDGLTVTREEKKDGTFATGLVEFDEKRFGVDVSIPPPKLSNKYPWAQKNIMTSGRYGLEGRLYELSPDRVGIDLRALLEIHGMDLRAGADRWIPRQSNGAVERNYFTRLSLRLLKPPGNSPPAR